MNLEEFRKLDLDIPDIPAMAKGTVIPAGHEYQMMKEEYLMSEKVNLNITREEYKLLKNFYKQESLIVHNDISDTLFDKGLITQKTKHLRRDGTFEYSDELSITNAGQLAFEKYREDHHNIRNASICSWVAVGISAIALIVSIISLGC